MKHTQLAGTNKYAGKSTIHTHTGTEEDHRCQHRKSLETYKPDHQGEECIKEARRGVTCGVCFKEVLDWNADGAGDQ